MLSRDFARALEDANHSRRLIERVYGSASAFARAAENADHSRRLIEQAHGSASAFARAAENANHSRRLIEQALGQTRPDGMQNAVALARIQLLQPQAFSLSEAVIDALQAEYATADNSGPATAIDEFEEPLDRLLQLLAEAITGIKEKVDLRALLLFIYYVLPIVVAAYGIWLTQVAAEQSLSSIEELEDEVARQGAEIQQQNDDRFDGLSELIGQTVSKLDELEDTLEASLGDAQDGIFYVVDRPVPMTSERKLTGPSVNLLIPGQEVELIERSGKWVRVIAYDLTSEEIRVGWVLKKYLKRVDAALK